MKNDGIHLFGYFKKLISPFSTKKAFGYLFSTCLFCLSLFYINVMVHNEFDVVLAYLNALMLPPHFDTIYAP